MINNNIPQILKIKLLMIIRNGNAFKYILIMYIYNVDYLFILNLETNGVLSPLGFKYWIKSNKNSEYTKNSSLS